MVSFFCAYFFFLFVASFLPPANSRESTMVGGGAKMAHMLQLHYFEITIKNRNLRFFNNKETLQNI